MISLLQVSRIAHLTNRQVKLFLLSILTFVVCSGVEAGNRYSVASGNWSSTSTWSYSSGGSAGAPVPTATDNVYIENNNNVNVNNNYSCANLNITSGSKLTVPNRSLTVNGTSTIEGTIEFTNTNGTKIFVGSVTVTSTGTWNNPANESITFQGGLSNQGTFNAGTGTYTFTSNDQSLSGILSIPRVTVTGVTLTNTGTLTVNSALGGTGEMLNGSGSTLNIDFSGAVGIATLTATATGNTVDYGSTGAQTVKATSYYNLKLSSARGYNAITIGNISIAGAFTRTATFSGGSGITATSITYDGTSPQVILATDNYFTYTGLTINNASGVSLNNNTTVNGSLTFTNGIISTGSNTLVLGSSATVTGAGTGKYVYGKLQKGIAAYSSSKNFEVGDAALYAPIRIDFAGSITTAGSITAFTTPGDHPNISTSGIDPSYSVNRYWTLTNNGVAGFTSYSATFNFNSEDLDAGTDYDYFLVKKYLASSWSAPAIGTRSSTSTQATGITTFGDFQIGQCTVPSSAGAITGNSSPCKETSGLTYSVTNAGGITYTWTVPSGWAITAGQGTNSITVTSGTAGGTISVAPYNSCGGGSVSTLAVTITAAPGSAGSISGNSSVCEGQTGLVYSVANVAGLNYSWQLPNGWPQTSGGTGNSIQVTAGTGAGYIYVVPSNACGTGVSSYLPVVAVATPVVTATATPTTTCEGSPVTLTATASSSLSTTLLSEGFNAAGNNWITFNNSVGGTVAASAWTLRPDGYVSTYSGQIHSNDATQFYFTDSDAQGSSTTTDVILQSPPICTQNYSSLSLSFYHYYRRYISGETAKVQVSTDGSSWTDLASYTTTQGSETDFANPVFDLTSYVGNATLFIRFNYHAVWGYYWAVDNVLLTGTPSTANYTYAWTASPSGTAGLPAGAGSYSSSNSSIVATPTASTVYTAYASTGSGCSGSSSVSVTVTPSTPAGVSITASENPVCSGSSVTFAATPVNGGSNPTYQWKVNGSNAGTNSNTFITSSLANNDVVSCVMTSNAGCVSGNPATSNSITMTVNPNVVASVSISASENPVCAGTNVIFTATPVNGGSSPSYQWKLNGSNVGTNSSTYNSSSLNNNDVVKCVMTSNEGCVTGSPATSNSVTMTINPVYAVSVSIAASPGNTICSGTGVTFTATPVNGGSSPSYQWKKNGSVAGTNSPTYSDVSLNTGDVVLCILTSSLGCTSGNPASSNQITMTVNPMPSDPLAISANPATLYSSYSGQVTLTASGGGVSGATLKWYSGSCGSGTLVGTGSPLTISPPASTTTYYARWETATCVSGCLSATVTVYSNYRSQASGNWNQATTWEVYSAGAWASAAATPSSLDGTVTICSPHTVTVTTAGGNISADEITIDAGGKLVLNASATGCLLSLTNGPGTDLQVNGTFECQDDQFVMEAGSSLSVGPGATYQHNLTLGGAYTITLPTATWDENSICEVLSSNNLAPAGGLGQEFGHFTWNCTGQSANLNLGGSLTNIRGNFSVLSTGSGQLDLTNAASYTLNIGKDLILQSGTLDLGSGSAATRVINLNGNYNQSGGTLQSSGSTVATINFLGSGKYFTSSSGSIVPAGIDWNIPSGASLTLNNDLPVGAGRSLTLGGILDCGISKSVSGAGTFSMLNAATLILGSPQGITSMAGQGNVQTATVSFPANGNFIFNGISAQVTGDRFPATTGNLTLNNSAGLTLSQSVTLNGQLVLNPGNLTVGASTLGFQNSDIPVDPVAGKIEVSPVSGLLFGTAGNTSGAAYTLPDNLFTSDPHINNLTINRTNELTLNNQVMSLEGTLLSNGPLKTNGNLVLLSTAAQTALIDGTGTGNVTGLVTVQRYLASGFGYKYISTPFQSATVNAFAPYVDLAAGFPSFYYYNENKISSGWTAYVNAASALTPMTGYAANFGSSAGPVTVVTSGTVNNGAIVPLNLYNNNQVYTRGFNLVGNPYPSPINWDAANGWTRTNIDNAVYYFNAGTTDQYTGTYSTYINGVSSDGIANGIIPAMQGFFIHVSDGSYPVSASFGMDNRVRINNLSPVYHKSVSNEDKPLLRISASYNDKPEKADHMVIYLDETAGSGFNPGLDALKLMNTDHNVPNLYSIVDGRELSIHAIPGAMDSLLRIPVGLFTELDGNVRLTTALSGQLPQGWKVYLEDRQTGDWSELLADANSELSLSKGETNDRLTIVFSKYPFSGKPANGNLFRAYGTASGVHISIEPFLSGNSTLTISNMLGQAAKVKELNGSGDFDLPCTLPAGVYLVALYTSQGVYYQKIYLD